MEAARHVMAMTAVSVRKRRALWDKSTGVLSTQTFLSHILHLLSKPFNSQRCITQIRSWRYQLCLQLDAGDFTLWTCMHAECTLLRYWGGAIEVGNRPLDCQTRWFASRKFVHDGAGRFYHGWMVYKYLCRLQHISNTSAGHYLSVTNDVVNRGENMLQ